MVSSIGIVAFQSIISLRIAQVWFSSFISSHLFISWKAFVRKSFPLSMAAFWLFWNRVIFRKVLSSFPLIDDFKGVCAQVAASGYGWIYCCLSFYFVNHYEPILEKLLKNNTYTKIYSYHSWIFMYLAYFSQFAVIILILTLSCIRLVKTLSSWSWVLLTQPHYFS